LRAAWL